MGSGGGVLFQGYAGKSVFGDFSIAESTISGNTSQTGSGGGFYSRVFYLGEFRNSTITQNTATKGDGGGIAFLNSPTLINSIISGNTALAANDIYNLTGSDFSANYSLIGDAGGVAINGFGNIISTNPMVGPLTDSGGPTLTHLPDHDSLVIDAGNNGQASSEDQRGRGRIVDGDASGTATVDIGAVELNPFRFDVNPGGEVTVAVNGSDLEVRDDQAAGAVVASAVLDTLDVVVVGASGTSETITLDYEIGGSFGIPFFVEGGDDLFDDVLNVDGTSGPDLFTADADTIDDKVTLVTISNVADRSIQGGDGDDTYVVLSGANGIVGLVENDGEGNDTLDLSQIPDPIDVTTAADDPIENYMLGAGDDIATFQDQGSVTGLLDGGSGFDTLDYTNYTTEAQVSFDLGTATGTGGISNFENAVSATIAGPVNMWTSPVDGDFNEGANWSLGRAPTTGDEVVIDVPEDVTVTFSSVSVSVNSLSTQERFAVTGGTLDVATTL